MNQPISSYFRNGALGLAAGLLAQFAQADSQALKEAMQGEHRTETYAQRDEYRNPVETLSFFEIEPHHVVVEVSPGGGWYTEILAPYLQEEGTLYAAHFPEDTEVGYYRRSREAFLQKLSQTPSVYSRVVITEFGPGVDAPIAPPRTADRVVTFRNVHNWLQNDFAEEAFEKFYAALKPGGILGVVEHRANDANLTVEQMAKSGYMTEAYVIGLAEKAGFELVERSDINANAKDTTDHPAGVWTLPPTLRLGEERREAYTAVGESNRMTLKFRKPGTGDEGGEQGNQKQNSQKE